MLLLSMEAWMWQNSSYSGEHFLMTLERWKSKLESSTHYYSLWKYVFTFLFEFLNQYGLTPLHVAAHYDNQQVALMLLDKGASPHATAKVLILLWDHKYQAVCLYIHMKKITMYTTDVNYHKFWHSVSTA